jgi:uncharacterized membrane protein
VGWLEFAAAFAAFFITHSVPVRAPLRPLLQTALGRRGFTLAYSALSLVALAWLIIAAGRAPFVPLWEWAPWQLYVPLIAMLPVCLILALAIARSNPFSFGGARNDLFDPVHPGIVRLHRHPLLLALVLWATAHAVPNGDLAHLILFGTFAVFASLGTRLVDRRRQREMGHTWQKLGREVARTPLWPTSLTGDDALRLVAGLVLYATLIWLHPAVIGVSPLP